MTISPPSRPVYSHADEDGESELVQLIEKRIPLLKGTRQNAKPLVILERNASDFKDGVDAILNTLGNFLPETLLDKTFNLGYLMGQSTMIYSFQAPGEPHGIRRIYARAKIAESLAQKALLLAANEQQGEERSLIKDGTLVLDDCYALTIVTEKPSQAKELWSNFKKKCLSRDSRGKRRGSISLRQFTEVKDSSDYYAKDTPYNSFHVTLERRIGVGRNAFFEVHLEDIKSYYTNNNLKSAASHLKMAQKKAEQRHSKGNYEIVIVSVPFGIQLTQYQKFQYKIIDQTRCLQRLYPDEELQTHHLIAGDTRELWDYSTKTPVGRLDLTGWEAAQCTGHDTWSPTRKG